VGDNAPPDPPFKAIFTVVETPIQPIATFQDADPPFDAMVVTSPSLEPTLPFMLCSLSRPIARFGKDDPSDAHLFCPSLVVWGVQAAVSTCLVGGPIEQSLVLLQARDPLRLVVRVSLQDAIVGDNATIYLVQPDLVSKLDGTSLFAPANDVGVWLKDTDQLFFGRHFLALDDTT
jgi:hypothetical protein